MVVIANVNSGIKDKNRQEGAGVAGERGINELEE